MKKAYTSPELIVRGTIEEITQGSGWGISDVLIGDGADDGGCLFARDGCDLTGS